MTESTERKKVMIVDDSEIVLAVAQFALESAGYEVVTHPRPSGCIALILQEKPDLLLVDVNMPGLNGDTVVKMLGSTQANGEMIVLLHSSLSDDVLAQKATMSHAHGYIRKSDSPQNLVRQVSRWMRPGSGAYRASSGTMEAVPKVAEQRTAAATKTVIDESPNARILLVDHEMVALSELRRLLISQPGPVEFALSGKEVLRKLSGDTPPDVVVLGRLNGSPDGNEVLREAARLSPRWKSRFILVHDNAVDARINSYVTACLRRPVTEPALRGAIKTCLQYAS
ncbi:MAG TPA: response regulator [Polyangiaceae bacterium]|nr:response regulator [Polyangiaceae bacterium]